MTFKRNKDVNVNVNLNVNLNVTLNVWLHDICMYAHTDIISRLNAICPTNNNNRMLLATILNGILSVKTA